MAITLCLGQPADVYLIDEPSAYLDSEQRIIAAKVIKRFIMHAKKTAFIVEHDFIMATYLADRVVVYEGEPSKRATATMPQSLLTGARVCRGVHVLYPPLRTHRNELVFEKPQHHVPARPHQLPAAHQQA